MPNLPRPKRHKYLPERKRKPGRNQAFYHSTTWRKLSRRLRAQHPICKVAEYAGELREAQLVDHIIAIEFGGSELDLRNLMPMSRHYHDRKSGIEAHGPFLRTVTTSSGLVPEDVQQLYHRLTGRNEPVEDDFT